MSLRNNIIRNDRLDRHEQALGRFTRKAIHISINKQKEGQLCTVVSQASRQGAGLRKRNQVSFVDGESSEHHCEEGRHHLVKEDREN